MPTSLYFSLASALCATLVAGAPTEASAPNAIWQPAIGASWDVNLLGPVNIPTVFTDIIDLDLFENSGDTLDLNKVDTKKMDALHSRGKKVICYFSGGSYELWRPDAKSFKFGDMGSPLDGWAGENWLNLRSANVANIMRKRIAIAAKAKCDAIDIDNLDAYENDNGMGMTKQDSINFIRNVLAPAASSAGLALGLKNCGAIASSIMNLVQFQINEQCSQYRECADFLPFIKAGKPVFHIEYPNGDNLVPVLLNKAQSAKYCTKDPAGTDITKFSTVLKTMNLNGFVQTCDGRYKLN